MMDANFIVAVMQYCLPALPAAVATWIVALAQGRFALFDVLRKDLNKRGAAVPRISRWTSTSSMKKTLISAANVWAEDLTGGQEFEVGKVYRIRELDAILTSEPHRIAYAKIAIVVDGKEYSPDIGRPITLPGGHMIMLLDIEKSTDILHKTFYGQKFRAAFKKSSDSWHDAI